MKRSSRIIATAASLICCGPDSKPRQQCAGKPDFIVTVSAVSGLLPEDTTISVTFGGDGHESYKPNAHNERQVLFCDALRVPSGSEGGASGSEGGASGSEGGASGSEGGASGSEGSAHGSEQQTLTGGSGSDATIITAITCELWTGGPASVRVRAAAWDTSQELAPKTDTCTVWNSIVLGALNGP